MSGEAMLEAPARLVDGLGGPHSHERLNEIPNSARREHLDEPVERERA